MINIFRIMKKIVAFVSIFIVSYIVVYFILTATTTTMEADSERTIRPFWFILIIALPSILGLFFPRLREAGLGRVDLITFFVRFFKK